MRSQSASPTSGPPTGPLIPALEQNRSIGPPRCTSAMKPVSSGLGADVDRRAGTAPISAATAATRSASRSAITTSAAPSATNASASPRPMPLAPPVITARRPRSSMRRSYGGVRRRDEGAARGCCEYLQSTRASGSTPGRLEGQSLWRAVRRKRVAERQAAAERVDADPRAARRGRADLDQPAADRQGRRRRRPARPAAGRSRRTTTPSAR